MLYLIYARVSPRGSDYDKSQETSCAVQDEQTKAHILRLDPQAKFIAPSVKDEFKSGGNNRRDGLRSILHDVASGKAEWDALGCWDIDRLSGSQEGFGEITSVLNRGGKGLIVARQNLDFATLHGRMLMGIMVVIKEYFNGLGAEKTKDKMRWMAQHGRYVVGRIPRGYLLQDRMLVPDEAMAPKVVELFRRYAAGETVTEIRRGHWNLPQNSILKMLRCQVYTGKVPFAGEWFPGTHPAIVPDDLWKAVQSRLPTGRSSPRPSACAYDYLLSGMVRCSCGRAMSPATQRKGGHTWPYYRCQDAMCPNRGEYVRADQLEAAIAHQMADLWSQPGVIEAATQAARIRLAVGQPGAAADLAAKEAALAPLEEQTASIVRNLSAGLLSPAAARLANHAAEDLAQKADALRAEIDGLRAVVDRETAERLAIDQMAGYFTKMATAVANGAGDRAELRRVIRAFVLSVNRQPDGGFRSRYPILPGTGSTSGPDWHPSRLFVEVPVDLTSGS